MTSLAAGFVKAALRIYTLRYRVRQASLSRNVKYRYKAYRTRTLIYIFKCAYLPAEEK